MCLSEMNYRLEHPCQRAAGVISFKMSSCLPLAFSPLKVENT